MSVALNAGSVSPSVSKQLSNLPLSMPKISCKPAFSCSAPLVQGFVISQLMPQVWPWLILSLQSHLTSIHPPHCWQNDLTADLITSLWSLKSSDDSPFVRPSLIWPLFSAQVSTPILSLHIMFQQYWIPRTSSKKAFLFYTSPILPQVLLYHALQTRAPIRLRD